MCRSVGFGGDVFGLGVGQKRPPQTSDLFDDDDEGRIGEEEHELFEDMNEQEEFPTFFMPELADALRTARKSLVLMRAAMHDHPLLAGSAQPKREVMWLWYKEDIEAAWAGIERPTAREEEDATAGSGKSQLTSPTAIYAAELAVQFGLFDLEPGKLSSVLPSNVQISPSLSTLVQSFISRFPPSSILPSLTPTLAHLNTLTFAPLVLHASQLSRALLGLFLSSNNSPPASYQSLSSKSNSNLNFSEHLVILRSYVLLTSHAFKSRLAAALFSDSGEYDIQPGEVDIRARARQLKCYNNSNNMVAIDKQWAVGLAPALTDRENWPPGGADLSFLLRTVIVDSLDEERLHGLDVDVGDNAKMKSVEAGAGASGRGTVLEEAEWRLGFAIRDLPVGAGRDRWLNPTCKSFLPSAKVEERLMTFALTAIE